MRLVYSGVVIAQVASLFAACAGIPAHAQASYRLELGDKGMANVTINFRVQPIPLDGKPAEAAPGAVLNTLVLPFQLSSSFQVSQITKPDNVEVSLLANREDYCMLSVLANEQGEGVALTLKDAFEITDERAHDRIKFTSYPTLKNLKQHRGILDLQSTISKYDIVVLLPQEYHKEDVFLWPRDQWVTNEEGRMYTLPASAAAVSDEVSVVSPSPFKGSLEYAQIVLSILIGLALLAIEGRVVAGRKLSPRMLILTLVLTLAAISLTVYFAFTLGEWRQLLAWAVGPLVPLAFAPFICVWLLVRPKFEAQLSGQITLDGGRPSFVDLSLQMKKGSGEFKQVKVKLDEEGFYHLYIWCRKSKITAFVSASGAGISEGKSEEYELAPRRNVPVPTIDLQRARVPSPGQNITPAA